MCCFFEARHQERERRQCSAHRREQCLVLFALCKSPGNAAWASPSSVPPSPSPSSIVAHPRCVCLLALRSFRLREKFDATWREGYAGISGTRRRYACNSSCRRTSPWSAGRSKPRESRYHQRPKVRRRRKAAAALLLHIRTKGRPQPWEKPRFKRRLTRSVSNFATENVK